jgi:hypothetical protein
MALFILGFMVFSLVFGLNIIGILEEGGYKNAVKSVDHAAELVKGYDEDDAANIGLVL